jgi:hypothetical protein
MIIGGVAGIVALVLAVGLTVFVVMRRKNSRVANGRDSPPTPRPLPFPNTPMLGQQHAPPPASIMLPPNNGIGRFGRYNRSFGGGAPGSPPSGPTGGGGGLSLPAGAMRPAGSLQLPPGIAGGGTGMRQDGPSGFNTPPGASGMANLTRINPQVRHLENA